MIDPTHSAKGNIQLGLGIKLPTGDYKYQDYYHMNDSVQVLDAVDQSIQLGDGGTGITTELNAFYNASKKVGLYGNFFYLLNPREQNGVYTTRGRALTSAGMRDPIKYGSHVMSVPDQFMFRLGASYTLNHFSFSGGLRYECLPSEDLIGGSNGFRRPGFVVSAEPVITYKTNKAHWYLSVPVAIERSRTQSVPDKIRSRMTGVSFTGDAAFADYTINLGVSLPLGK
jgi:hypothetical protein